MINLRTEINQAGELRNALNTAATKAFHAGNPVLQRALYELADKASAVAWDLSELEAEQTESAVTSNAADYDFDDYSKVVA